MPLGPTPELAVTRILEECQRIIGSVLEVDELTVRRCLRELEDELPNAPGPMLGKVYSAIGMCRYRLHDLKRALEAHRNAAKFERFAAAHESNIGCTLKELGRLQEALEHFRLAHAKPDVTPDMSVRILVNEAETHLGLGNTEAARRSFEEAARGVQPTDVMNLLNVADVGAELGRDEDSVEFYARFMSAIGLGTRGDDEPAESFIRSNIAKGRPPPPAVQRAIEAVLARWDAPMPAEHEVRSQIELPGDAWATFSKLAGAAPER